MARESMLVMKMKFCKINYKGHTKVEINHIHPCLFSFANGD